MTRPLTVNGVAPTTASTDALVALPGGAFCQEFHERLLCGAASDVDACASNPAGLPH